MALITAHVHLTDPSIATAFQLILPDNCSLQDRLGVYPLLWLPADRGIQYDQWVRKTPIERWAEQYGFAVVCPDGQHSNYANMAFGPRWYTYLSHTLPAFLEDHFPVVATKSLSFAFGYGMGALGLLRMAAEGPDGRFQALGLANADLSWFLPSAPDNEDHAFWMDNIYGVRTSSRIPPEACAITHAEALQHKDLAVAMYHTDAEKYASMLYLKKYVKDSWDSWREFPPSADEWGIREAMLSRFITDCLVPCLENTG